MSSKSVYYGYEFTSFINSSNSPEEPEDHHQLKEHCFTCLLEAAA
uniref:Uncharacterized protein n=1 Tax=Romanomermis culicivorax TaxID=13658 RepID=A0A915IL72_ROMCU